MFLDIKVETKIQKIVKIALQTEMNRNRLEWTTAMTGVQTELFFIPIQPKDSWRRSEQNETKLTTINCGK